MARKIGFGSEDQRRDARASSREARSPSEETPPRLPIVQRVVLSIALALWLAGWTVAISFAAEALRESLGENGAFHTSFLAIWLMVAAVAWWVAARALLRVIRGQPIATSRRRRRSGRRHADPNWTRDDTPEER